MVNVFAIIALGLLLGMRHATDPDHVIAVTTIVSRERNLKQAAVVGGAWGVGHTLTIMAVGTAMIAFRIVLPPRLGLAMEMCVAVMLVMLGLRNIKSSFASTARTAHSLTNGNPAPLEPSHSHFGINDPTHSHDTNKMDLGCIDLHCGRVPLFSAIRPLIIGIVHGLAGSAAIALLVLSTIQNLRWAAAYLLVFGVGTIMGMMLITMAIASMFKVGDKRLSGLGRHFGWASGALSIAFGLFAAYQIGIVNGLFTAHPIYIAH